MIRSIMTHWRHGLISCLFVVSIPLYGQWQHNFTPSVYQDTITQNLLDTLKARNLRCKSNLTGSRQAMAFARELYDQRYEYLVKTFNNDYFMVATDLTAYLQRVTERIYRTNPHLTVSATVYPYRSSVPNAVSFGDGTIAFMLGLLERLENEDQVAFVICHELAHLHADHTNKKVQQLAALNFDKDLKKKLMEIRASEFNRYSRMKALMKEMGISMGSHSREHELEADSIGLTFFIRAGYNPASAIRCMEILDSVDVTQDKRMPELRKTFQTTHYAFKDSWLTYKQSTVWHKPLTSEEDDTLKTHPDCQRRIRNMQAFFKANGVVVGHDQMSEAYHTVRESARFDLADTEYHFKNYGKSLFRALMLLQDYPDNVYAHALVGRSLYRLYESQKNHELGKVLELPDGRFPENYDRVLSFIHTLRLGELGSLTYYYMVSRPESYFDDENFLYTLWLCSGLPPSQVDRDRVKEDYIRKFPNGRYRKQMN